MYNEADFYEGARIAFDLGKFDLAEELARRGLVEMRNNQFLLYLLSRIMIATQEYPDAREFAEQAIALDPEFCEAYHSLAIITLFEGKTYFPDPARNLAHTVSLANELADQCLGLEPEFPSSHLLKARVHLLDNSKTKALACIETALSLDPNDEDGLSLKTIVLMEMRKIDSALEVCHARLKIDPEDADCHQQIAEMLLERKDIETSRRHAREALRLAPTNNLFHQAYWDTVKASSFLFRPFVAWHFVTSRIDKLPYWLPLSVMCVTSVGAMLLAAHLGEKFDFDRAMILALLIPLCGVAIFMTERPCMALVDLILLTTDSGFRATVDRKALAIESGITIYVIAFCGGALLCAVNIVWPLVLCGLSLFYLFMLWALVDCERKSSKAWFVLAILISIGLLATSFHLGYTSYVKTPRRYVSMLCFFGFALFSLGAPILYIHFKYEKRSEAERE